jgi:DNA-binding response OmpR family regulator
VQNLILLVEDDPDHILLIERALRKVRLANPIRVMRDGEEARDYLSGAGTFADRDAYPLPMLVLLDLKLPRLSGLELLRWIRAQQEISKLSVAVLTSSKDSEDLSAAFELGIDFYLIKPAAFDTVLDLMMVIDLPWAFQEN